jgi:hypothetical protein
MRPSDYLVILSARHGFLDPDTIIEPYKVRMGDPGSITLQDLARQVNARPELEQASVVTPASDGPYLQVLRILYGHYSVRTPIPERVRWMPGKQQAWLQGQLGKIPSCQ